MRKRGWVSGMKKPAPEGPGGSGFAFRPVRRALTCPRPQGAGDGHTADGGEGDEAGHTRARPRRSGGGQGRTGDAAETGHGRHSCENFDVRVSGTYAFVNPRHAYLLRHRRHRTATMRPTRYNRRPRGEIFLLTGALRSRNVTSLIKTDRGIGPLTSGQPSVPTERCQLLRGSISVVPREMSGASMRRCLHGLSSHRGLAEQDEATTR